MSGRNHRRRSEYVPDQNIIIAIPVSPLEPTPVQSVSIEDYVTEEIRYRWAELRAANQILGERSLELINRNDELKEQLTKTREDNNKKKKKIEELESKVISDSLAIQMYKDKIRKLMNDVSISTKRIAELELAGGAMIKINDDNKHKCADLVTKLNKVKTELPINFERGEYDNIHFINYLIDLTLEDISKLNF